MRAAVHDPFEKTRRQQAILGVLRAEEIGSQEELRRALRREGFPVTQATLSRDLKELRVPCVPTATGYRYSVPGDPAASGALAEAPGGGRLRSVAAMEVRAIEANEASIIVRTLTGRAQGVAVYIDGLRLPGVLATIAGDDTILVVPRSVRKTAKVRQELETIFGLQ